MWYVKMVGGELDTETREQMMQTKLWELKTPNDGPHPVEICTASGAAR